VAALEFLERTAAQHVKEILGRNERTVGGVNPSCAPGIAGCGRIGGQRASERGVRKTRESSTVEVATTLPAGQYRTGSLSYAGVRWSITSLAEDNQGGSPRAGFKRWLLTLDGDRSIDALLVDDDGALPSADVLGDRLLANSSDPAVLDDHNHNILAQAYIWPRWAPQDMTVSFVRNVAWPVIPGPDGEPFRDPVTREVQYDYSCVGAALGSPPASGPSYWVAYVVAMFQVDVLADEDPTLERRNDPRAAVNPRPVGVLGQGRRGVGAGVYVEQVLEHVGQPQERDCGAMVMTHEIGHLFGLDHLYELQAPERRDDTVMGLDCLGQASNYLLPDQLLTIRRMGVR